jgi:hypothetical protein
MGLEVDWNDLQGQSAISTYKEHEHHDRELFNTLIAKIGTREDGLANKWEASKRPKM